MENDLKIKLSENTIALLHTKCTRGIYSKNLFKIVSLGGNKYYPFEKIEWMKDFLYDKNQQLASSCAECLCCHGMKLNEIHDVIKNRLNDKIFSNKIIDLAESNNDPNTLLLFMDEKDGFINRIVLALKKTNNESYLTTLMLSENVTLVKTINKITNS